MPPILHILAVVLDGWLNRHQQRVLDYLLEENRILKRQLRGLRLRLTETDRCRLAVRGHALGRRLLDQLASIVSPETILRWHRRLIARKWTFPSRRPDRRLLMQRIAEHVVRMARENPTWGYDRIQGALANLDHRVAPNTIARILKKHGIDPAPERARQTTWQQFLRTHMDSIAAGDFFSTEVWTARGLVTWYTFFVIDLATRAVTIVGSTPYPDDEFMKQVARNLTDCVDSILRRKRFLILDRDGKYSQSFRGVLEANGIRMVLCPARAPNCNAFAERFVRSIKSECLDRMIFIGSGSLRHALAEYIAHYDVERNHQGIGNRLIEPASPFPSRSGALTRHWRLGGLLSFYCRAAASRRPPPFARPPRRRECAPARVFVRLPVEISIGDSANPLSRTRDARRFSHDRVFAPYGSQTGSMSIPDISSGAITRRSPSRAASSPATARSIWSRSRSSCMRPV